MRFTFSSPANCSHIHVETDDGQTFVTTFDQMDQLPETHLPAPILLVKNFIKELKITTFKALKKEMEDKDVAPAP